MSKVVGILDSNKINYEIIKAKNSEIPKDGISVAENLGLKLEIIFKTLFLKGKSNKYVFVIPANKSLNMKKISGIVHEKKLSFLSSEELYAETGCESGGCSPIGLDDKFKIFFDISVNTKDRIIINAGNIGVYLNVFPNEIVRLINANVVDITK